MLKGLTKLVLVRLNKSLVLTFIGADRPLRPSRAVMGLEHFRPSWRESRLAASVCAARPEVKRPNGASARGLGNDTSSRYLPR